MNNLLFGLISVFMFAITGLGFAEVKGQMDMNTAAQREVPSEVAKEDSSDTTLREEASVTLATKETVVAQPSVSNSLAEVTQRVADAFDDVTFGRSHDDEDEDEDDWGEDEDEDDDDRVPQTSSAPPTQTSASAGSASNTNSSVQSYTMTEVAVHNSSASCWSAINGSVYDLTSFITQHPGGQTAIKSLCGVDGSGAYNGQHGGQSRPESELASLKIGVLK